MAIKYLKCLVGIFAMLFLASGWASATVKVYAEGAYTDSDLVVYIYVDVTVDPILSYGVKLTYDFSDLGYPVVEKNNGDWYFGERAAPFPTPNAEPDTSIPGDVVIVGGKLDAAAPREGVSGERILLAKVTFSRLTGNTPSVELYLGKGGTYSNFVQVNGEKLDESLGGEARINPIGPVSIFKRGDAETDGDIDVFDILETKNLIGTGSKSIWADCEGDGDIDVFDILCIKNKI